jgi:hypothetical protein
MNYSALNSHYGITITAIESRAVSGVSLTGCIAISAGFGAESVVADLGEGKKQVFFQGLWYRDRVERTLKGWRISELVEEGYWNHNLPEGFKF